MTPKKSLITCTLLLLAFIVTALMRSNNEFLFYASTLILILVLLWYMDRRIDFSRFALWGFNLWMLMHLAGGMATIDGVRLYDFMVIDLVPDPYNILKYDQIVHFYCYFIVSMLVFETLSQLINGGRTTSLALITVLAATGIGGLNEIIEFGAVVLVGSTGVGGYTNTALDLVANLLGAMAGAVFCTARKRSS
jgi:uncharacterized membrane protein YjdF